MEVTRALSAPASPGMHSSPIVWRPACRPLPKCHSCLLLLLLRLLLLLAMAAKGWRMLIPLCAKGWWLLLLCLGAENQRLLRLGAKGGPLLCAEGRGLLGPKGRGLLLRLLSTKQWLLPGRGRCLQNMRLYII